MRKVNLLTFLLVCCVQLQSQTIDQIVTRHLDAIGGVINISKIQCIIMNGRANVAGNALDIHIFQIQGKLCRRLFKYMDVNNYDITIAGMEGWTYSPFLANALPIKKTSEEKLAVQDDLNIADRLYNYQQKKNKLILIGKEEIDGKLCFKIGITDSLAHQSIYYIDTKTFLIVQTSENNVTNGQDLWEDVSMSHYKLVNGVLFPFEFRSSRGKTVFNEITVQPLPFASNTWNTIENSHYTIKFPDDMVPDTTRQLGADLILYTYQDNLLDSFTENLTVCTADIDTLGDDIDLMAYTRISLPSLKEQYRNFEIQTDAIILSGNDVCHKWIYSGVANDNKYLKFEQYTFIKNKRVYILTLTTEADKYILYKEKAEKVMNSFLLK